HPHIVNGIEVYREKPIVYSLGNWFIPHNYFWNGTLNYHAETRKQLAFEWDPEVKKGTCHWFSFDSETNTINFDESNILSEDLKIQRLTPFAGMDQNEYAKWFKVNRVKRKGLPIYFWDDSKIKTAFKNKWVNARGKIINTLLKLGLK